MLSESVSGLLSKVSEVLGSVSRVFGVCYNDVSGSLMFFIAFQSSLFW